MRVFVLIIFSVIFSFASAQDLDFARKHIDTLASEGMHGRGYVNNGDQIAKDYLLKQMKEIGLQKWRGTYLQKYNFPINTFPDAMKLVAGDKEMKPGYDFQVKVWSGGLQDTLKVMKLQEKDLTSDRRLKSLQKQDLSDYIIVLDPEAIGEKFKDSFQKIARVNIFGASGYILLKDTEKLTWSVAGTKHRVDHVVVEMKADAWNDAREVVLDIEQKFKPKHQAYNLIGYLPGREQPDSIVMITAHYDHLGRMGKNTCYCGAHDNASGVAFALDLARHFAISQNRPDYSMMFVLFSGEEAGLHGSRFFAKHPPLDLGKIKVSFNIDLIGSGSDGISVVNGKVFEKRLNTLVNINQENDYVAKVKKRGTSNNSDHYPLYAKDVPAFFIYTMGDEYTEYHNPDDKAKDLPLTAYDGLFKLMRDYVNNL